MNTATEARKDAQEYARALMFYGEGAGTRRKLINATVTSKMVFNPEYERAFYHALENEDLGEHAEKAKKERKRADRNEAIQRNARAIKSGNYQNAQTGVVALIVIGYFAHQTGLDKKAWEKSKQLYADFRRNLKQRKADRTVFKVV